MSKYRRERNVNTAVYRQNKELKRPVVVGHCTSPPVKSTGG